MADEAANTQGPQPEQQAQPPLMMPLPPIPVQVQVVPQAEAAPAPTPPPVAAAPDIVAPPSLPPAMQARYQRVYHVSPTYRARIVRAVDALKGRGLPVTISTVTHEMGTKSSGKISTVFAELGIARGKPFDKKAPLRGFAEIESPTGTLRYMKDMVTEMTPDEAIRLIATVECQAFIVANKGMKKLENIIDSPESAPELVIKACAGCAEFIRVTNTVGDSIHKRNRGVRAKVETKFALVDQTEAALVKINNGTNGSANGNGGGRVIDNGVTGKLVLTSDRLSGVGGA